MPRKTAKPYLRIDQQGDFLKITHYAVFNSRHIHAKTIVVEREDKDGLADELSDMIAEGRERFTTPRNV